jgi:hypothetical protein
MHALSGIRTHVPSIRANEDSSCLRPFGHCDRRSKCMAFIKKHSYVMKMYGGNGGMPLSFLTSALDGCEWSASQHSHTAHGKITPSPVINWIREKSYPCKEGNPVFLARSPSLYELNYPDSYSAYITRSNKNKNKKIVSYMKDMSVHLFIRLPVCV